MANVAIFEPGQEPVYLLSVNTPEYCDIPEDKKVYKGDVWFTTLKKNELPQYAKANVVINPDLTTLQGVPEKFWKKSGNAVVEMTPAEKQAITNAEAAELKKIKDGFKDVSIDELINALISSGKIGKKELETALKEVKNG